MRNISAYDPEYGQGGVIVNANAKTIIIRNSVFEDFHAGVNGSFIRNWIRPF